MPTISKIAHNFYDPILLGEIKRKVKERFKRIQREINGEKKETTGIKQGNVTYVYFILED